MSMPIVRGLLVTLYFVMWTVRLCTFQFYRLYILPENKAAC